MRRAGALAVFAGVALFAGSTSAAPQAGAGYGEGMVLQRGVPIEIAGKGTPNGTILGTLGKAEAQTGIDGDGRFRLTFPALPASTEPLVLTLRDAGGTTRLEDILIGDVFLCAGQSNMELPVTRALDVANVLRDADDPAMRLFKVPLATASLPQESFSEPVAWKRATSESV